MHYFELFFFCIVSIFRNEKNTHQPFMQNFKIFIVEDDAWYGELLEYHLSQNPDYTIKRFLTGKDCINNLTESPDLITLDYALPDGNGLSFLKKIKQYDPSIPVIAISGQDDVTTAVELLRNGAYDYLTKDENTKERLWNMVLRIKENHSLKKEVDTLKDELGKKYDFGKTIIGNSLAIRKVFTLMEKASQTNINVSITGETGTGKELVAKAIHYNSERKKKPFVAVNMAAIPKELIESELFGHEKGSFTGAIGRKIGLFEEAIGGTIFLDEIAELDLSLQSKLLRVVQERELTRVGSNEKVSLDVRVIVATHKNLKEEVQKKSFREDLYYRIIGLPIDLPNLRDRGSDVLLLSKFFADAFCKSNNMPNLVITAEAQEKLMSYSYPGNVRELKALIDVAAVMCNGKEIMVEDINLSSISNANMLLNEEKTLKEYTQDIIQHFLNKCDGNVVKAAAKLDIGKSTIYKMIQNNEIEVN